MGLSPQNIRRTNEIRIQGLYPAVFSRAFWSRSMGGAVPAGRRKVCNAGSGASWRLSNVRQRHIPLERGCDGALQRPPGRAEIRMHRQRAPFRHILPPGRTLVFYVARQRIWQRYQRTACPRGFLLARNAGAWPAAASEHAVPFRRIFTRLAGTHLRACRKIPARAAVFWLVDTAWSI